MASLAPTPRRCWCWRPPAERTPAAPSTGAAARPPPGSSKRKPMRCWRSPSFCSPSKRRSCARWGISTPGCLLGRGFDEIDQYVAAGFSAKPNRGVSACLWLGSRDQPGPRSVHPRDCRAQPWHRRPAAPGGDGAAGQVGMTGLAAPLFNKHSAARSNHLDAERLASSWSYSAGQISSACGSARKCWRSTRALAPSRRVMRSFSKACKVWAENGAS